MSLVIAPVASTTLYFRQVFGASLTGTGSGFLRLGGECSTTIDANAWILPLIIPSGYTTLRITHICAQLFNAGTGTGSFRYRIFSGPQASVASTNAYIDHPATSQLTATNLQSVNTQVDFSAGGALSLKQEITGSVTGGGTRPIVTVLGYYL